MKLLIYTVVVRYQAIILDFRLTLSLLENQLARVYVAAGSCQSFHVGYRL